MCACGSVCGCGSVCAGVHAQSSLRHAFINLFKTKVYSLFYELGLNVKGGKHINKREYKRQQMKRECTKENKEK